MKKFRVIKLNRGQVVQAKRDLDGGTIKHGTMGVVFEEANAYGDGYGPMVRWMNMQACNVYYGDVRVLR